MRQQYPFVKLDQEIYKKIYKLTSDGKKEEVSKQFIQFVLKTL